MSYTKAQLLDSLPQVGRVDWIGIRTERRGEVRVVQQIEVNAISGLAGDHYGKESGRRQVTLIQAEHIQAMENILQRPIDPAYLRRNIVVSGINLLAFTDRQFQLGEIILEATGICHPCSRMETDLGPGAYNAMRGHGGITARVVQGGTLRRGDEVKLYAVQVV